MGHHVVEPGCEECATERIDRIKPARAVPRIRIRGGGCMVRVPTGAYDSQIPVPHASFISPQQFPQYPTQGIEY